jgi:hypothetical protein
LCLYEHIELQLDTPEPFEHSFHIVSHDRSLP